MALVDLYPGVIFDYGGVLVHHQTDEDHAKMARIAGLDSELFSELYWSDRGDYDRGSLTGEEYWARIGLRAKKPFDPETIASLTEYDTVAWMKFDPIMFEWINRLRMGGKKLAVLSNMPPDLGQALKSRTDKLALFDHVTFSYEVSSIKPEPAIYESCLEGLGLSANEAIFLDDRIENVNGAELLGIRGRPVHVTRCCFFLCLPTGYLHKGRYESLHIRNTEPHLRGGHRSFLLTAYGRHQDSRASCGRCRS